MTKHDTILKADQLSFAYHTEPVIRDLTFSMKSGEFVVIVGENGSGKSTFLNLLTGELKGEGGLQLLGKDIHHMTDFRKIGYVPQNVSVNRVAFPLTCLEMVCLSLYRDMGFVKTARRVHREKARKMLVGMGLKDYVHTPFRELSGGLQQRVMICRALMHNPEILILDEPTAGIDQASKTEFLKLLQELNEQGVSVILVTHELGLIREHIRTSQILTMKEGGLVCA